MYVRDPCGFEENIHHPLQVAKRKMEMLFVRGDGVILVRIGILRDSAAIYNILSGISAVKDLNFDTGSTFGPLGFHAASTALVSYKSLPVLTQRFGA